MRRLWKQTVFAAIPLQGWLPALALALLFTPETDRKNSAPSAAGLQHKPWSAEEATPDCDIPPPQPFPDRQRKEHLVRLGVDRWHAAGYRGQGVTIAVLDSGFRGYRSHLGQALPARVTVRSFRTDGNLEAKDSQHGILCCEVLHALAPEARLLLANWEPECPEQFLAAARWARQQGARIISCSVIMPSWSDGEGGGTFHQALARILGPGTNPGDLLCFASAGNTALRHWSGLFRNGGDRFHEWRPGLRNNTLTPWSTEEVSVELYWQPGPQYDLFVLDAATGARLSCSLARERDPDRSSAVVHFIPQSGSLYDVQVRLARGKGGRFHLVALGGMLSCTRANGSISCPADSPRVIAVGAVNSAGQRASYSSCGPNSPKPKPDLVAPVPFPSLWRAWPFTGTSAAAPQAAALAALCWSRHPQWTANRVCNILRSAARDLGPPGHDWETGYGLIHMPPLDIHASGPR